jgi:hypothetical protein
MVISDSTSDRLVANSVATENPKTLPEADIRPNGIAKKIRIHIGVITRLLKDQAFYLSDADKVLAKINEMKVSCFWGKQYIDRRLRAPVHTI